MTQTRRQRRSSGILYSRRTIRNRGQSRRRTPPPTSHGAGDGPATAKSFALSTLRSARLRSPRSPRSPRGKGVTHMWDVVRYVSGVYGEVYKHV